MASNWKSRLSDGTLGVQISLKDRLFGSVFEAPARSIYFARVAVDEFGKWGGFRHGGAVSWVRTEGVA